MSTVHSNPGLAASLFGGTRRGVLALLFGHPGEGFYLRQIARMTGSGLGAVQREVNRLAASGILHRSVRGHQVYFQANEQGPVFGELKSLVMKTAGAVDTLRAALLPLREQIRSAFLYGSFAEGREDAASDVDLVVVGDAEFDEVVEALASAQERLQREVNPTVYPAAEFRSKLRAGHHFLTAVMKGPKIILVGGESELARLGSRGVAHRASQQPRGDSKPARSR